MVHQHGTVWEAVIDVVICIPVRFDQATAIDPCPEEVMQPDASSIRQQFIRRRL